MPIATTNPATGEVLQPFNVLTDAEVDERIARAAAAFAVHRRISFTERAERMRRAASILRDEKDRFARLMTLEMGKTLASAAAEVEKCALGCDYYAEHAEGFLADEDVETEPEVRAGVRYRPLGVVLAVMPWNFPFWQVFRFAAPALMAGNVGLLKHASNVPQCALAIEDIFQRAGFADNVFQTLLIGSGAVPRILADSRIVAATLTGSTPAGSSVAEHAGKHIKKTVLELGGSDPFIVLPSADLEVAAKTAAKARCINNGQSCIAAKRFIVHNAVADEFERRFVDAMRALRVGDPMDGDVDVGPLATSDIRDEVAEQVRRATAAGARLLLGGEPLPGNGFFYPPTVLAGLPTDAEVAREEIFGPVALLFRMPDLDAAIRLANDTPFGLGASVWTNDQAERLRCEAEIEAGMIFTNAMVASDPRVPFGGVRQSGYGRELSRFGIREFVNIQTVWAAS